MKKTILMGVLVASFVLLTGCGCMGGCDGGSDYTAYTTSSCCGASSGCCGSGGW